MTSSPIFPPLTPGTCFAMHIMLCLPNISTSYLIGTCFRLATRMRLSMRQLDVSPAVRYISLMYRVNMISTSSTR
ncbi:alpha-galactosidase [Histoplasma capsulatum]|uniref:Alpha-galactosidase n=1 Tax=Ajellomyces capsulatus TaxID=5037 RepID=A0A8A1MF43_AJECA|nr:alpha-galactosidase [Histoplasma capsulatum]